MWNDHLMPGPALPISCQPPALKCQVYAYLKILIFMLLRKWLNKVMLPIGFIFCKRKLLANTKVSINKVKDAVGWKN